MRSGCPLDSWACLWADGSGTTAGSRSGTTRRRFTGAWSRPAWNSTRDGSPGGRPGRWRMIRGGRSGRPTGRRRVVWTVAHQPLSDGVGTGNESVQAVNVTDRYTRDRVELPEGSAVSTSRSRTPRRRRLGAGRAPDRRQGSGRRHHSGRCGGRQRSSGVQSAFGSDVTIRFDLPDGPLEVKDRFLRDEQMLDGSTWLDSSRSVNARRPRRSANSIAVSRGRVSRRSPRLPEPPQRLSRAEAAEVARRLRDHHAAGFARTERPRWSSGPSRGRSRDAVLVRGARRTARGRRACPLHLDARRRRAPKRVNDQQWENQKRLYRPDEGVYLAPRAPTDTWNLWHRARRRFLRPIDRESGGPGGRSRQGLLHGVLGRRRRRLPARSADGRSTGRGRAGGRPPQRDATGRAPEPAVHAAHGGRRLGLQPERDRSGLEEGGLADLAAADEGGYPHEVVIHEGKGHWMEREDAVAVRGWPVIVAIFAPSHRLAQDDVVHRGSTGWRSTIRSRASGSWSSATATP